MFLTESNPFLNNANMKNNEIQKDNDGMCLDCQKTPNRNFTKEIKQLFLKHCLLTISKESFYETFYSKGTMWILIVVVSLL